MSDRSLRIEALAGSGEGVARDAAGATVRVRDALPGERVLVAPAARGRKGEGVVALEVLERLEASAERVTPPCAHFAVCGGCSLQHASPALQREARLGLLRRALPPALRDTSVRYEAAPDSYRYRTRARLAFEVSAKGTPQLGFRERRAHALLDLAACPVLDARLEAALPPLRRALAALPGCAGEASLALGEGGAPVVSVRCERGSLGPGSYAALEALVRDARAPFAGVSLAPAGGAAAAVYGAPRPVVQGADGAPLRLATEGFAQANEALNARLAGYVAEAVGPASERVVVELYAGAGNFTVLLARRAKRVTAVEASREAVAALRENVAARGLENVRAVEADAGSFALPRCDALVLDPPRTGAAEVCAALAKGEGPAPREVVYVSCDPATLGRDLATLAPRYEVTSLTGFEMFPQTTHLEVVATLRRRTAKPPR